MATNSSTRRLLTARDTEILAALHRCPLTAQQLLKLSQTFEQPFTHERLVRRRLQALAHAGRVRQSWYATAGRGGSPAYYQLTLLGYRLLHGPDAEPPTKRYLADVGVAHQLHTQSLADFIVHTAVAAHRHGIRTANFVRENTFRLTVGDENIWPDCGFQLVTPAGRELNFFVELDNSTERLRSQKETESWERKIHLYDEFQDFCAKRFRVLVITTRSEERVDRILSTARQLVRNQRRSLFYGVHLPAYLAEEAAVLTPCFWDHRGGRVALVPRKWMSTPSSWTTSRVTLAQPAGVC